MREIAKTGDKLTIRSGGFLGNIVTIVMGDSESHVAILMWDASHTELMIIEMRELRGYNVDYASNYVKRLHRAGKEIAFNRAPDVVVSDEEKAKKWLKDARRSEQPYGYAALILVFLMRWFDKLETAQFIAHKVLRIDFERIDAVCSIFAQRFDQHMGFNKFKHVLVGPGAFKRYSDGNGSYQIEENPENVNN